MNVALCMFGVLIWVIWLCLYLCVADCVLIAWFTVLFDCLLYEVTVDWIGYLFGIVLVLWVWFYWLFTCYLVGLIWIGFYLLFRLVGFWLLTVWVVFSLFAWFLLCLFMSVDLWCLRGRYCFVLCWLALNLVLGGLISCNWLFDLFWLWAVAWRWFDYFLCCFDCSELRELCCSL